MLFFGSLWITDVFIYLFFKIFKWKNECTRHQIILHMFQPVSVFLLLFSDELSSPALVTEVMALKPSSFCFSGEGFHNYHHTFPYDYAASEFGSRLNLTTAFINLMCALGLAKDPKTVSKVTIIARMQRTGDVRNESNSCKWHKVVSRWCHFTHQVVFSTLIFI